MSDNTERAGTQNKRVELVETDSLPEGVDILHATWFAQLCAYADNSMFAPDEFRSDDERIEHAAARHNLDAHIFHDKKDNLQVVVFQHEGRAGTPNEIIVAFSGSQPLNSSHYLRNLDFLKVEPSAFGEKAKVHPGFNHALDADEEGKSTSLWDGVKDYLADITQDDPTAKLHFIGHSAGGSFAAIAASRWVAESADHHVDTLCSFGNPRVGGSGFRDHIEAAIGKKNIWHFDNQGDPVSALPPFEPPRIRLGNMSWTPLHFDSYKHFGTWVPMRLDGTLLTPDRNVPYPTEDTMAYFPAQEGAVPSPPQWEEVIGEDGKPREEPRLREATTRWFDFVSLNFEPHMLSSYCNALEAIALKHKNSPSGSRPLNQAEEVRYLSTVEQDKLALKLTEIYSILESCEYPHAYLADVSAMLFSELRDALKDITLNWRGSDDSVQMADSIIAALHEIAYPEEMFAVPTEQLTEQLDHARNMLDAIQNTGLQRSA